MKKILAILVTAALFAAPVFADEHKNAGAGHEKACVGDKKCAEEMKCEAEKKCHEAKCKNEKCAGSQKEDSEHHDAK